MSSGRRSYIRILDAAYGENHDYCRCRGPARIGTDSSNFDMIATPTFTHRKRERDKERWRKIKKEREREREREREIIPLCNTLLVMHVMSA